MSGQTFANVWDAIEATPQKTETMKLRSSLMMALEQHIRSQAWTQGQAAKHLGVTQPRVSDLLRGKINLFSLDMLVTMAAGVGLRVEMQVQDAT